MQPNQAADSLMAYNLTDRKIPLARALHGQSHWRRAASVLLTCAGLLLLAGCREDMHNQPKFIPLRENTFYPDGRSARPVLEGTIARGQLEDDSLLYTGKVNDREVDQFPFPITAQDLDSLLGDGNGMIVQRGFKHPPAYFEERLLKAPVGHFFNVMTNGWGAMPDYSAQVPVADRWRIAAYIRALQLSRTAKPGDLPPGEQVTGHEPEAVGTQVSETDAGEETMGEPSAERVAVHTTPPPAKTRLAGDTGGKAAR